MVGLVVRLAARWRIQGLHGSSPRSSMHSRNRWMSSQPSLPIEQSWATTGPAEVASSATVANLTMFTPCFPVRGVRAVPFPTLGAARRHTMSKVLSHRADRASGRVDRRRRDLHAHGAARDPDHRARDRAPYQPRRSLGGGHRSPLRSQPGARRLQDQRRRRHLGSCAAGGREHRRDGPRHRPLEPEHAFRGHLPAAPHRLLLRGRRGPAAGSGAPTTAATPGPG